MATINKITTKDSWEDISKNNKQCVLYFTLLKAEDEFTKGILEAMYKEFEEYVEKDTSETKYAVLDLSEYSELADGLQCRALSSFHGYIDNKLVSKTGQTKEIKDLEDLMEELKDPENILPYKVTSQEDFDKIIKDEKLVACDFTAAWCGPCQMIGPKFKEMAKKQRDEKKNMLGKDDAFVKFIKVEQTENKDIVEKAGVKCYPSFYMYRDGKKVEDLSLEGADEDKLATNIKTLIDEKYVEVLHANFTPTKGSLEKAIKENDVVFVDFTASWCPPCKMIKPIYEDLATQHKKKPKVLFLKVDVDENEEASQFYQVRSMPTFKVFKGGVEKTMDSFSGASVEKLKKVVEKYTRDIEDADE